MINKNNCKKKMYEYNEIEFRSIPLVNILMINREI